MTRLKIFSDSLQQWFRDDMDYYAAAFSYYAPLAFIPLILLSIGVSGYFYGREFVTDLFLSWGSILGSNVLELISNAVTNLEIETQRSYRVPVLGLILTSAVSIVAFNVLAIGFQRLWGSSESGLVAWLRRSFRSLLLIVILQIYLILLIGFEGLLVKYLPFSDTNLVSMFFLLIHTTLLFACTYRFLVPRAPSFGACMFGALVASGLFLGAKSMITIYLSTKSLLTIFGAAGFILVLLVWVYVLASIIYYGAVVAYQYDKARRV